MFVSVPPCTEWKENGTVNVKSAAKALVANGMSSRAQ